MSDHHLSARVWATAALLSLALPADVRLGLWLPLHLALAGAVSQLIAGGQVMFSSSLGRAPNPPAWTVRSPLFLLNLGVAGIALGRVFDLTPPLVLGGTAFLAGCAWTGVVVHSLWRRSLNPRFQVTKDFYLFAVTSILIGGSLGIALGAGWLGGSSYGTHRIAHLEFNLLGWAGLTVIGTAVTLLPTMLHVRIPTLDRMEVVPRALFASLILSTVGLTMRWDALAAIGALLFAASMLPFAYFLVRTVRIPRRRRVPASALHLIAAVAWLGLVIVLRPLFFFTGDLAALRDLYVFGLAGGFVIQAVIGAWAFLLPMERPVVPDLRRRELVAFEVGVPAQFLAYNGGILLALAAARGLLPDAAATVGLALTAAAATLALVKAWGFRSIARTTSVQVRAREWWAQPGP